jgi:hypothetical protein
MPSSVAAFLVLPISPSFPRPARKLHPAAAGRGRSAGGGRSSTTSLAGDAAREPQGRCLHDAHFRRGGDACLYRASWCSQTADGLFLGPVVTPAIVFRGALQHGPRHGTCGHDDGTGDRPHGLALPFVVLNVGVSLDGLIASCSLPPPVGNVRHWYRRGNVPCPLLPSRYSPS